jgi:hypothetical protein
MKVNEDILKEYWIGITGLNVDYEPYDKFGGTLILDLNNDTAIDLSQLWDFKIICSLTFVKIRLYEFGIFIDVENEDGIDFEE